MHTTKQSRGYSFESSLVKRFNSKENWHARRLGGSSAGLPDIVATNNKESLILIIEAKAGTQQRLVVDKFQIEKCLNLREMFSLYRNQLIVFAFKFMVKTKENGNEIRRELREFYYIHPVYEGVIPYVACNYKGLIFKKEKGKEEDFDMRAPFFNFDNFLLYLQGERVNPFQRESKA